MVQHQQPPLPQRTVLAAINAADCVVNTVSNTYAFLRTKAIAAKEHSQPNRQDRRSHHQLPVQTHRQALPGLLEPLPTHRATRLGHEASARPQG